MEVEYRYSLFNSKWPAYWNINGDKGKISFYLGNIWDIAKRGPKPNVEGWDEMDSFIDDLLYYDISERFCLERAHEKIKIKRGKCNPCCVKHITELAMYPHAWNEIRKNQKSDATQPR